MWWMFESRGSQVCCENPTKSIQDAVIVQEEHGEYVIARHVHVDVVPIMNTLKVNVEGKISFFSVSTPHSFIKDAAMKFDCTEIYPNKDSPVIKKATF